ncbi:MAG: bifunctional metallophosphatase/5'-nucleotidase [Elusimicrobia bacterium]|nr:bifunctional metallophosphatase/5'-nucleotidase [Elusimicrobiota bacterium]
MRTTIGSEVFLGALLLASCPALASAENIKLTVFHTSDVHGWIMARPAFWYKEDPKRMVGGFAALSSVVKAERGPKLLLDSGDWFQGTPEGYVSRGGVAVDLLNALDYDAVVVGNHDFDFGQERLRELIGGLKVPALAANIRDAKTHSRAPWVKPWIVKEVAGVRVGVFGLTYANMRAMTFPENIEGLEFRCAVDEAKDAVAELKKEGATVIIAATHLGFESPEFGKFEGDQTLARKVPGIDLIAGGHTHKLVFDPPHENGTLITQPGNTLSNVGKVVLEIDPKTKKVVSSKGELVTLWIDQAGEDPEVLKLVKRAGDEVSKAFDVVIGTAAETVKRERGAEGAMGDWFTDCVRDYAGTDIALSNGSGIRADIPAGPITLRTIYNVMPFDNRLVKLTMTGKQVEEAFDHGAGLGGEMVQESGAAFSYSRGKPSGERVSHVLVGGKPLAPSATYTLETSDFLVSGGDGFASFKQAKQEPTKVLLRDVIRRCVEKSPLVKAPAMGRMISLEDTGGTEKRAR